MPPGVLQRKRSIVRRVVPSYLRRVMNLPAIALAVLLAQDRMPPISAEKLTPEQKKAAAELIAGPRGALGGPFIPALRSPEFMDRLQRLGEYLRYKNALGPKLGEM